MLNPSKRSEDKGLGVPRNTDRDELIIKLRVSERWNDNVKKRATEKNNIYLKSTGDLTTYSYNF